MAAPLVAKQKCLPMVAGIDFSTYAVDVVTLPLDPTEPLAVQHRRIELRPKKETGDLAAWLATSRIHDRMVENSDIFIGVVLCFIERGHGKGRNNDWKLGRVQGAILASVPATIRANSKTWEVDIGEWKREFTGHFYADKEQVIERCRELGFVAPDDNAADAFGIAYGMRQKNQAEIDRQSVAATTV